MFAREHTGINHIMLVLGQAHLFQVMAITDDGIERCSQLVADAGEEVTFGAVRCFSLFLCTGQFFDQRAAI